MDNNGYMEDVPNIPTQDNTASSVTATPTAPVQDLNKVLSDQPKNTSVISYAKKKTFLDYFIYVVAVIAFLVWVAVIALYLQNRNSKTEKADTPNKTIQSPTPVPAKKYNISTKNGDIVNVTEAGAEEIIVKKTDFPLTGISGFIKVVTSPDKKKLCFESWPPSPEPALFISDIDGKNIVKVGANRKNCSWSSDSQTIAYNDVKSEKEGTDIYTYNLTLAAEKLLTVHTATESAKPKLHTVSGWVPDGKMINCKYSYLKTSQVVNECEVEVESGFVNYF